MQINSDVLLAWGAVSKRYRKNDFVFQEGDEPRYYFQIASGSVRMFNANDEGREFTQGSFEAGSSFGEPPLFIGERYPSNAICQEDCVIYKLSADKFFNILDDYPQLQKSFIHLFARRLYNKSVTARNIIHHTPEERIKEFLNNYKSCKGNDHSSTRMLIPFTRQEIANCTGLRVETVIRTLSKMQEAGKVEINNRKLYF